jgi:hypothetical protein
MAEEIEGPNLSDDPQHVAVANRRVRGKDYQTVYANFAQIGQTPWDVRLLFSQLGEIDVDQGGVTDLVTIVITPALAKALINVLITNIKAYERDNGEIKLPESILREVEKRTAEAKVAAEAVERNEKLKPEF